MLILYYNSQNVMHIKNIIEDSREKVHGLLFFVKFEWVDSINILQLFYCIYEHWIFSLKRDISRMLTNMIV